MDAFRRTSGRGVRARFDAPEAVLLRSLIEQVVDLLTDPDAPPPGTPGTRAAPETPGPSGTPAPPGPAGAIGPAGESLDPGTPGVPTVADLEAMLGMSGTAQAPEDPALARLLPDAYRDDPDAAGEFRRFTEQSLRSAKQESARIVLDTLPADGGPVKLSGEQAQSWLRALNDVRLALGVRLGVTEEFEEQWQELDPVDPRSAAFEVYAWLGGVQESLVQALT
ncbi:MAG: DUF2017 domain-containing protein [Streptosporangiaceae bacterium]|jgi:hypothetical protein